ncbi:hypothetical protein IVB18_40625 [Bradyrhizobium sp. 186]|uniref:hypothetical protein n=1 Tax=Bradyrhizobium sp. 186 TaxID=2782654 RepID=UPI002001986E|nr:hypothetical protein [Bradyrhizobium sp. 186]UPK34362.1 hypothetical protein IVB18_40625 [Bradyrhizobium sp. 186]
MFIIVQIPFADFRPVVTGERARLRVPDWGAKEPKGFVRGFGKISLRNSSGLGLAGESRFADMGNAIRFPEHIDYREDSWPSSLDIVPWFRRLYFDGQIAGRFEIGFLIAEDYEELVFDRAGVAAPIRPAMLAQRLLATTVQINSVDGSKQTVPFARCSKLLGLAYLAASTSNSGLMSYPIAETFGSVFFAGDPLVTIRIASGRPIVDGRDRRYLTSHNEPALFITSARGSQTRNNVIVQASERGTREETSQERITRVLFAHFNSLVFAYAQLQDIGSSIAGKTNREILRTAVKTMIDRLAIINEGDARDRDAAFSEGLRNFAKAHSGRIEELATKLEALSAEWNKPTKFERFRQYLKGVHDLVIRTGVEKAIDISMKGGT